MKEITINADGIKFNKVQSNMFLAQIDKVDKKFINMDNVLNISSKICEKVKAVVAAYKPNKCKTTNVNMRIVLKDDKPVFQKPCHLPLIEREIVDRQIENWLRDGIIESCTSEYASPLVIITKKDGSSRV